MGVTKNLPLSDLAIPLQRIQTTVQPGMQQAGPINEKAARNLSLRRHLWLVSADRPRRDCPVGLLKRWCANSKMTQTQSWPFDIKDINENKCECAFGCLGLFLSSRNERGCALLACLSVIFCSVADDLPVSLHLLLSPAGCGALAEVSAEGCWDRGGPDPGEERRSGGTASTGMIASSRNVKMSQHKAWTPQGWDSILVCCQENRNNSVINNIWRNCGVFAPRPCISVLLCNSSPISFSWFRLSAELITDLCAWYVNFSSPASKQLGCSLEKSFAVRTRCLPSFAAALLITCLGNPVMPLVLSLESWKMRYWPEENILYSNWKW